MKINRLPLLALLLAAALVALLGSSPVGAQDEATDEEDDGAPVRLLVQFEIWAAQPAGLDFTPATQIDPGNPYDTNLHMFPWEAEAAGRFRLGFDMGKNGAVIMTWFDQGQESELGASTPGQFIFGETMANPLYAGFNNDGLADGYAAYAGVVLRDFRIDYYRTAFKSPRMTGRWFVGWRRAQFGRETAVVYPALAPPLPPLIPPYVPSNRDDLQAGADLAGSESRWEGRGLDFGMDFTMPLISDKFGLIGGFALSALRGKTDTEYSSLTHYYVLNGTDVLSPPYDEISDPNLVNGVTQEVSQIGLRSTSRSTTSAVIEGFFGVQWNATRWFDLQLGFRSSYYDNVGVDLRPKVVVSEAGLNVQDVTETDYSVTYEGFFLAAGFLF